MYVLLFSGSLIYVLCVGDVQASSALELIRQGLIRISRQHCVCVCVCVCATAGVCVWPCNIIIVIVLSKQQNILSIKCTQVNTGWHDVNKYYRTKSVTPHNMDRPLHRMLQNPINWLTAIRLHIQTCISTATHTWYFYFTLKHTKGLRGWLQGPNAQSHSTTKENP